MRLKVHVEHAHNIHLYMYGQIDCYYEIIGATILLVIYWKYLSHPVEEEQFGERERIENNS